jgi:hypothetical protein
MILPTASAWISITFECLEEVVSLGLASVRFCTVETCRGFSAARTDASRATSKITRNVDTRARQQGSPSASLILERLHVEPRTAYSPSDRATNAAMNMI